MFSFGIRFRPWFFKDAYDCNHHSNEKSVQRPFMMFLNAVTVDGGAYGIRTRDLIAASDARFQLR